MSVGAFGEIMLRLTPPERLVLEQTESLRIDYTGTGVNILANLAHFGIETQLLSSVPENRLGDTVIYYLRKFGIDPKFIIQKFDHLGSYIAEMGYGSRPTEITYQNRLHSSFSLSSMELYDIDRFLKQNDIIHICGISLSLTNNTSEVAITLAKNANILNKTVCFDFNYRPSLNKKILRNELNHKYQEILPYCDIVFGSVKDIDALELFTEKVEDEKIFSFIKMFNLTYFVGTNRKIENGTKYIQGYIYSCDDKYCTDFEKLDILDRIGGGDAFAAGFLLGYIEEWEIEKTLQFALTNAILAHTVQGDITLTTREQVYRLIENKYIDIIR